MRAAANTPVDPLGALLALFPSDDSLPRFNVRVGFHITLFGACSTFTTRCSPHARRVTKVTLYTRGFSRFVTSTTAPIATGRSESCRVGLSPTGKSRLCTAHVQVGSNASYGSAGFGCAAQVVRKMSLRLPLSRRTCDGLQSWSFDLHQRPRHVSRN